MTTAVAEFGLGVIGVPVEPTSQCYRPPSWPPPSDWVISLDADGAPVSRWGDVIWDFSYWAGVSFKLAFGEGDHGHSLPALAPENQHLMRLVATWMLWNQRGVRTWTTFRNRFYVLRRVFALCDDHGVLASDLSRFPKLLAEIARTYEVKATQKAVLLELDRLWGARKVLGFSLVEPEGLSNLAKLFAERAGEDEEQTAYIPPRIWSYQVLRLKECLEDFLNAQQQVENCFHFCVDAYAHNFGSLEAALQMGRKTVGYIPFGDQPRRNGKRNGRRYHGPFAKTAESFGIAKLLEKWIGQRGSYGIKSFTAYLTLVQFAGLAYLANFTLQRKEEVGSLRADCLIWELDDLLGRIAIVRGETTKTDPDCDARWPTSPSVELAVNAMSSISRLRMRCAISNAQVGCSQNDVENPYLVVPAYEPWCIAPQGWKPYSIRPTVQSYLYLLERFPQLFDEQQLRITEADLEKARMFTPNLDKGGAFKVGLPWPLAFHQLRRTGGVNMFASGLLSDSSIQVIMKHLTLMQSNYYGRNHTRLKFSEEVEGITVAARYEVMAKQITDLVNDRYVAPAGDNRKMEIVVRLIAERDFKALIKAGKRGEISFRETRLGGCTKIGHCEYGGIESIARCAGGDGDKPCRDAIFDKANRQSIKDQLSKAENILEGMKETSPRSSAIRTEVQGYKNFLDLTQ